MRALRLRSVIALVTAVLALVVGVVRPAAAAFTSSPKATTTLSTESLAAPTRVKLSAHSCNLLGTSTATLTWSPSTSSRITGYYVYDTSTFTGTTLVATVPASATTATFSISFLYSYSFTVKSYVGSWTSASSANATTPSGTTFSCLTGS